MEMRLIFVNIGVLCLNINRGPFRVVDYFAD